MSQDSLSRRGFIRAATGTGIGAGAVAAGGTATAQSERPDWGGWLDGVDGGFQDARGQSEVTVEVGASGNGGNFAFSPAGLWVDPGTTVTWEWTGEGGGHNVVAQEGPADLDSGGTVAEPGIHYEHTFEEGGITTYFCQPHQALGMKGAVAVGDDVPTGTGGGDGGGTPPDIETPTVVGRTESSLVVLVFGGLSVAFLVVITAATLHLTYLGHQEDRHAGANRAEGEAGDADEDERGGGDGGGDRGGGEGGA